MQCNKCGYLLQPFDGNCPKCGLKRGAGWVDKDFGKTKKKILKAPKPTKKGKLHMLGPGASMFSALPRDKVREIATQELCKERSDRNYKELARRNKSKTKKPGLLFTAATIISSSLSGVDAAELAKRCKTKRLMCHGKCPACKSSAVINPRKESCTINCPKCKKKLKFKDYVVTIYKK